MANRSKTFTVSPVDEAVTDSPVDEAVTDSPVDEAVTVSPVDEAVTVSPVDEAVTVSPVEDLTDTDRDRYNSALQKASDLAQIKHEKMLIGYYAREIATVKFNRDRAIFSAQFAKDLQALQKSVNNRK